MNNYGNVPQPPTITNSNQINYEQYFQPQNTQPPPQNQAYPQYIQYPSLSDINQPGSFPGFTSITSTMPQSLNNPIDKSKYLNQPQKIPQTMPLNPGHPQKYQQYAVQANPQMLPNYMGMRSPQY